MAYKSEHLIEEFKKFTGENYVSKDFLTHLRKSGKSRLVSLLSYKGKTVHKGDLEALGHELQRTEPGKKLSSNDYLTPGNLARRFEKGIKTQDAPPPQKDNKKTPQKPEKPVTPPRRFTRPPPPPPPPPLPPLPKAPHLDF